MLDENLGTCLPTKHLFHASPGLMLRLPCFLSDPTTIMALLWRADCFRPRVLTFSFSLLVKIWNSSRKESLWGHCKDLVLLVLWLCLVLPGSSMICIYILVMRAQLGGLSTLWRLVDEDEWHQVHGCITDSGEQLSSDSFPTMHTLHTYGRMECPSTHCAAGFSL